MSAIRLSLRVRRSIYEVFTPLAFAASISKALALRISSLFFTSAAAIFNRASFLITVESDASLALARLAAFAKFSMVCLISVILIPSQLM